MTTKRQVYESIVPFNNRYRDERSPVRDRLVALWEIGDVLVRAGIANPHSLGWQIQRESKGLIKRPTIFRGHKIRCIWKSRSALLNDIGGLRGLSSLTEMLPLIDSAQGVRAKLPAEVIAQLYRRASEDAPGVFKQYAAEIKAKYASGRLGARLDRRRHLKAFSHTVRALARLMEMLRATVTPGAVQRRREFRRLVPEDERRALSNMCIALTTKENGRLYKGIGPGKSAAAMQEFRTVYDEFRQLLRETGDVRRARLRRLVDATVLAGVSDLLSSVGSEEAVVDYWARQDIALRM